MPLDPFSVDSFAQANEFTKDPASGDRTLNVRFFMDELQDEEASAREGRPIYKSVEMCEIRYGDKDNIVVDRVKYMHPDPRKRFAAQYARFKAGEATQVEGTLLRQWGLIGRAEALSYEGIGVVTVEQLAGLSDQNAQQIRGALADRQKARDFLMMSAGQAPISQARAEIEALRAEIRALRDGKDAVTPPVVSDAEPPKVRRKPGPKPKNPQPDPEH